MVLRVRLGLTFGSLERLRRQLLPVEPPARRDLVEAARIAWGVRVAARGVPFASCLTQAQACQILLAQRGISSTLYLGVREDRHDAMAAHAWLLCEGMLVLGGTPSEIRTFRPLAELGPAA